MGIAKALGLGALGAGLGLVVGSAVGYADGWITAEFGQHVVDKLPIIGSKVDFNAATKSIIKSYSAAGGGVMGTIYGGISGLAIGVDSDLTYLSRAYNHG